MVSHRAPIRREAAHSVLSPKSNNGHVAQSAQNEAPGMQIGILLHEVARLHGGTFKRLLRPHGMSQHQWWILACLMPGNGMTQTAIAAQLGLGKNSVGKLVDRLEERGWIVRRRDPADRRMKYIFLKTDVEFFLDEVLVTEQKFYGALLAGIPKKDQRQFLRILLQMKENYTRNSHFEPRDRKSGGGRHLHNVETLARY
jgi:MarR family transcriptional regulator, transcriptional regulator for hemolysin